MVEQPGPILVVDHSIQPGADFRPGRLDLMVPSPVSPLTATDMSSGVTGPTMAAQTPSSSLSKLEKAIGAILWATPTSQEDVDLVKSKCFEGTSHKKFRGVTRHKRTQRFEAHIWESKKQIYLGGFESELWAARSHDIMALKCKGLQWGSLNFNKEDYSEVIELLDLVQKEDIIYCLREFSKLFAEAGPGGHRMAHAHHHARKNHVAQPQKGAPALKPILKIRKNSSHESHQHHHNFPGTPNTPYQSSMKGNGAPVTPKEESLVLDSNFPEKDQDIGLLFDPEQPVDDLCMQGIYLPCSNSMSDMKNQDTLSVLYESLESQDRRGGDLAVEIDDDILDAWQ